MIILYDDIINFWFKEIDPTLWWKSNNDFDSEITNRFGKVHHQGTLGKLDFWRITPEGSLAEIIILDQFSRYIFRGMGSSFRYDHLALEASLTMINERQDLRLDSRMRGFLYMPLTHSESAEIQDKSIELFEQLGLPDFYLLAKANKEIIDRFGRYPYRNKLLGRQSTLEELEFLNSSNSIL